MSASRTMSHSRRGRAAAIVSAIAVVCLVLAGIIAWAHPWRADADAGRGVTRFEIGDDEMRLYADICAAQSCGVAGGGSAAGNASVADVIEQIRSDKALLLLAKQHGYGDATTYDAFIATMKSTNSQKTAQAKSGETVYGVTSYTPVDFHSRLITQAREYLDSKLSAQAGDPLYVSQAQAKSYFLQHRDEWRSQDVRTVLQISVPAQGGRSEQAASAAAQRLEQALAAVNAGNAVHAQQSLSAALPGATFRSMTLDSSAAASPQMQDLIGSLRALQAGDHTDVTAEGGMASAYLVTAVTAADDETDWTTYQSRIMAKLVDGKLDRLVASTAKDVTIELDEDKLNSILAGK